MTQLVTLAEGVHCLESTLRIHAGFYMPVRSTLLRVDDGGLVMISPVRVDDTLADLTNYGAIGRLVLQGKWPEFKEASCPAP